MQKRLIATFAVLLGGFIWGCDAGPTAPPVEHLPLVDGPSFAVTGGVRFAQFDAGLQHNCTVKTDGSIDCWGRNAVNESAPPVGSDFAQVSAGSFYSCAVKTDGSLACWADGRPVPPAGTDFVQVDAGGVHACAIKTDGSIACWGDNSSGQTTPPVGNDYVQVTVNLFAVSDDAQNSCALKTDGSIVCWGSNPSGNTPPSGTFVQLSTGTNHSCAVNTDGSLACWGSNFVGESTPPGGNDYAHVSAGRVHSCAVKTDGSVLCWGFNDQGQSTPPAGNDFAQVGAGNTHTCALKTDGSLQCWGDNFFGQATPPQPTPGPTLTATKVDALETDANGNGVANPGDVISYTITIDNTGIDATGATFSDSPDANTTLVATSVTTTQGSVTTGNGGGVLVDVGTISSGGTVTITFDVTVNAPFPGGVSSIANQGTISGSNFDACVTDDPDTVAAEDATVTQVEMIVAPTPMAIKAQVRDDLSALLPTGHRITDLLIQAAVHKLNLSLTPAWWLTEETLHHRNGKKVFDRGAAAVLSLAAITWGSGPIAGDAQTAIDALVECYRALAQRAIDDAIAAGGNARRIRKAERDMRRAARQLNKGRYTVAILKYRNAWKHAIKALP